jgi:hypothetical protein
MAREKTQDPTEPVTVTLPRSILRGLRLAAKTERRSLSALLALISVGYLTKQKKGKAA